MPYLNAYNMQIAQQLRNIDQNHINRIQAISETNEFDVRSPLEATALVNDNIHGGSGYSAATVMDMGFEPTAGATPATGGRIRRKRATNNISGSGTSGGGVSGGGTSGGGTSGGGVSGGALLTLNDMYKMQGQPPPGRRKKVAPTASPHKDQPIPQPATGPILNGAMGAGVSGGGVSGGGRGSSARNQLVRQIMKEKGLSLPQASKHIKENNLYSRS